MARGFWENNTKKKKSNNFHCKTLANVFLSVKLKIKG